MFSLTEYASVFPERLESIVARTVVRPILRLTQLFVVIGLLLVPGLAQDHNDASATSLNAFSAPVLERQVIVVFPWGLTFRFLKQLAIGLWLFSPLLCALVLAILLLGYLAGKEECWSRSDSFYWAFVTATTVGYGDFRPTKRKSRLIAVVIAVLGLLTTGIIVALGVLAATKAWKIN